MEMRYAVERRPPSPDASLSSPAIATSLHFLSQCERRIKIRHSRLRSDGLASDVNLVITNHNCTHEGNMRWQGEEAFDFWNAAVLMMLAKGAQSSHTTISDGLRIKHSTCGGLQF